MAHVSSPCHTIMQVKEASYRQRILKASSDCSTIGAQTNRGRPIEFQKSHDPVFAIGCGTVETSTTVYFASRDPSFPETKMTPSGVCFGRPFDSACFSADSRSIIARNESWVIIKGAPHRSASGHSARSRLEAFLFAEYPILQVRRPGPRPRTRELRQQLHFIYVRLDRTEQ